MDRPNEPGSSWSDGGPDQEHFAVLLIVTYRPEFEPPWIGRPYVTALTLNRLGEREIAAMIDRVTGNKALPAEYQAGHYRAHRRHSAVR